MKSSKTFLQLFEFNVIASGYLAKHENSENKLCASITNVIKKQLKPIFEEYKDRVDTLQLNNCVVNEVTQVILKDEKGNRQYTVAGEIKLKGEIKALLKETVEIHQRIPEGVEVLIKTLTEDEKEVFSGIVIPEINEMEIV